VPFKARGQKARYQNDFSGVAVCPPKKLKDGKTPKTRRELHHVETKIKKTTEPCKLAPDTKKTAKQKGSDRLLQGQSVHANRRALKRFRANQHTTEGLGHHRTANTVGFGGRPCITGLKKLKKWRRQPVSVPSVSGGGINLFGEK